MSRSILGEISPNIAHQLPAARMEFQAHAVSLLPPKGGLQFLKECLQISEPSHESSEDWVFVSMSIKNTKGLLGVSRHLHWAEYNYNFQIGISILDLKTLPELSANDAVKGNNFVGTTRKYFDKVVQDFHFGQTQVTHAWDAVERLANMIATCHAHGRKVILVGHSLKPYIRVLQDLGLDVARSFHACIDTYDIAHEVFECVGRPTFTDLLEALDIKHAWLSCAGNYANYVTKALLSLATYDWKDYPPTDKSLRLRVRRTIKIARNLVISNHSRMFPENYRELPKSKRKPQRANFRDCVTEKKIRDIRSQNRDWAPSWDEIVLCSRIFRCSLLDYGGPPSCTRN